MSHCIRIIPRLDIKGPNVVKPVHTEALRVVGDPRALVLRYYEEGADELFYADIVASLYQRSLDVDLLKRVTEGIAIPVTVAGGICSIGDITQALRAGADKVAVNTYGIHHPEFLREAVRVFGAQCIVLFVEAKRRPNGTYEAYTDGGREPSGKDVLEWIKEGVACGIGEILVGSIDQDGTRRGYDMDLLQRIAPLAPVPVIAHGGAGSLESIVQAVTTGHADALAMSSVLHYGERSITDIKQALRNAGLPVRL